MIYSGLTTLDVQGDAGVGRAVWLADRIQPTDSVVDLGGTGSMLTWHKGPLAACDDLSGFGKGHQIHAPRFIRGDVCNLDAFADGEFDVAVLAEVLEHVPLCWEAMREAGRVAKRVLITTPCEGRWQQPIAFRVSGHLRFFTLDLLALFLRRAGLDGTIGLLEFSGWSFYVAEVARVASEGVGSPHRGAV